MQQHRATHGHALSSTATHGHALSSMVWLMQCCWAHWTHHRVFNHAVYVDAMTISCHHYMTRCCNVDHAVQCTVATCCVHYESLHHAVFSQHDVVGVWSCHHTMNASRHHDNRTQHQSTMSHLDTVTLRPVRYRPMPSFMSTGRTLASHCVTQRHDIEQQQCAYQHEQQ